MAELRERNRQLEQTKGLDAYIDVWSEARDLTAEIQRRISQPMVVEILEADETIVPFTDTRGKNK